MLLKLLWRLTALWVNLPDITGDNPPSGSKTGVPGGTTLVPGGLSSVPGSPAAQALPTSPHSLLQQTWRPQSFLQFHATILKAAMALSSDSVRQNGLILAPPKSSTAQLALSQASQASQALDQALQFAYINTTNLQAQVASRQAGKAVVTGSQKAIPTGLSSVKNCSGSIDNGAAAHAFTVSVTPSQTPGAIDIFVWQPTAAGNTTPTAGTTAVTVRWIADGGF